MHHSTPRRLPVLVQSFRRLALTITKWHAQDKAYLILPMTSLVYYGTNTQIEVPTHKLKYANFSMEVYTHEYLMRPQMNLFEKWECEVQGWGVVMEHGVGHYHAHQHQQLLVSVQQFLLHVQVVILLQQGTRLKAGVCACMRHGCVHAWVQVMQGCVRACGWCSGVHG